MIMLNDENSFDMDAFLTDFKKHCDDNIDEHSGSNSSAAFKMEGNLVGFAHMSLPIPKGDIEEAAKYAYNWPNALNDLSSHKSHIIVTVAGNGQQSLQQYTIFTQVTSSLLRTTNSTGVYMGNQTLLISKKDYLTEAELMDEDFFPLNLWIHFGLRTSGEGNSGYTHGLKEFDKTEMEILGSEKGLEDIREFLFNISHYVLEYDVTFHEGETCGTSEDEKVPLTLSKGKFIEGETFKLAY